MKIRGALNTEQQNPNSTKIDRMTTKEILTTINDEDSQIANTVKQAIPEIILTVDHAINSIKSGGRIFYVGAGTSGRLGVLDASEISPTFSASDDIFIGIIAGGDEALRKSIEGAEDCQEKAIKDLKSYDINSNDTLIGISCSGAAAYVISALDHARSQNAKTIYLVTNPVPYKMTEVDIVIKADTGPEVITGSTRMKAGTATKMILNMISTTTMIRLGKVYGNLMVDLMAVNEKLIDRGTRIIIQLTRLSYKEAKERLLLANKSVKIALVMFHLDCGFDDAKKRLEDTGGYLNHLID